MKKNHWLQRFLKHNSHLQSILNIQLKSNENSKILFLGWVGNFNITEKSMCYDTQAEHTFIALYKDDEKNYRVTIGCVTMDYSSFIALVKLNATQRYIKVKELLDKYHTQHNNLILREQEINALTSHHSHYYKKLFNLFETLIEDDRLNNKG